MIAAAIAGFALGYFVKTGLCWVWHGEQLSAHRRCNQIVTQKKTQGPVLDKDQLVI